MEDWPLRAKCRGMNDALFPEGKDQKRAKAVCMGCPVRPQCLAEALDNGIEWGVWGGMTERERRQLLRQRPEVKSWAAVLGAASAGSGDGRLPEQLFTRKLDPVDKRNNGGRS
ncbi:WhiB family transcriptional regulator [Propionibacterium cyclohexanicum]|uniref:WhiB family transcriptional regulator n=1 Tax=Propionibacterium cyclohexanicum TaxID=64702 RepID=UPI002481C04D|nr:WhiB family transcriptional regulator [Propionibacterium cyclohexanicum]